MTSTHRRAFLSTSAATVFGAPTLLRAQASTIEADWAAMSRAARDAVYNCGKAVPDSAQIVDGWSGALPGYTLAPAATLTQIVAEIRRALDWLAAHGGEHGIAGPVVLTGWSAGVHLTALMLDHPHVTAGIAMSGLFELGRSVTPT